MGIIHPFLLIHLWPQHHCVGAISNQKLDVSDYGGRSSIWLEHKIVDLGVAGSIPVGRPICNPLTNQKFFPRFVEGKINGPICNNEPDPKDWVLLITPDYRFNQIPLIHAE